MIPQCKGKDLDKIALSKLEPGLYYGSIKYDGHYGQIHKLRDSVVFYTSGGKPFKLPKLEQELLLAYPGLEFVLEYEYNKAGKGMLGDRTTNGKLTTYRVNTEKGICNAPLEGNEVFRVYDIISFSGISIVSEFNQRLKTLKKLSERFPDRLKIVEFTVGTLELYKVKAKQLVNEGYEGIYLKHNTHKYLPGKRVNNAIKLKYRPTADLLCIGVEPGDGKYKGLIGSLVLKDSENRIVKVGSGLSDNDRARDDFVGAIIEIEYEQILDTYIQPTYIGKREDKTEKDID